MDFLILNCQIFLLQKAFISYIHQKKGVAKEYKTDWIRFENNRNNNLPRTLGIPNPFAYANLCVVLKNNWNELLEYFKSVTSYQPQKVSRSHVRKLKKTHEIFQMNYKNVSSDGSQEPFDYIACRYVVEADISKCFESIYTHSISWALIGKSEAKKRKDKGGEFQNKIDHYSQCTTNGETHGLLIGPVSSNLLSEIILCKIDNKLKDFKYYRVIDDYRCYVSTLEDAKAFIIALKNALYEYGLAINDKKIKVHAISEFNSNNLSQNIHKYDYRLDYKHGYSCLDYNQVKSYLDIIDNLFHELGDNASVYYYVFKIFESKELSFNARRYYVNKAMNLSINFPYLLFSLNKHVFSIHGVTQNLELFCKTLYQEGIKESNFEKCCYALYFGLINNTNVIDKKTLESDFVECEDCITRVFMWLYYKNNWKSESLCLFKEKARELSSDNDDFNRNWLFVYEVLDENELNEEWAFIKQKGISFIDSKKIAPHIHWKSLF